MLDILETDLQQENEVLETELANIQDITDRIDILINSYCDKYGFESPKDLTPQQFDGLLMFIRYNLFAQDKSILYKYIPGISNNHRQTNMIDDDIIYSVCVYYMFICRIYNKIPCIYGFTLLTGVKDDTILKWSNNESQRPRAGAIYKMLKSGYEKGLENGAQSGKNPVGYIAALNHRFGWSSEGKTSVTVNINRTSDQIMSTYNQNFIENNSENGQ